MAVGAAVVCCFSGAAFSEPPARLKDDRDCDKRRLPLFTAASSVPVSWCKRERAERIILRRLGGNASKSKRAESIPESAKAYCEESKTGLP